MFLLSYLVLLAALGLYESAHIENGGLSEIVQSVGVSPEKSALIIIRLEDGTKWMSGRFRTAYSPASTAKIPHTLIALEEGYRPESHFEWDGQERSQKVWNQDQTLLSAYRNSALWVYQQITRDLGYETMSTWIDKFEYGNRNIGSPETIATYWLDGPLEISAHDQAQFLCRLAGETLPVKAETVRASKQIMLESSGCNWSLYTKTGYNGSIGWYVGWVETGAHGQEQKYIFAFNMDIANWDELPKRKLVVLAALSELGIIPSGGKHE